MVAVLYSPGFGAGWSTWAGESQKEWALFSPEVVAWVEGGKVGGVMAVEAIVKTKFGESYFYCGGAEDLEIEWLPEGAVFRVEEYDGNEGIVRNYDVAWSTA
jgi:hypothetical protein